jgi:arylsulfatase
MPRQAAPRAGRTSSGELPLRTGLTTVGQAGADVGMPDQAVTLATVLKSLGYETAQFGKNHLGDLNKFLLGMTPFRATKGTVFEGGFRVPCIIRWPGKIRPGAVENGLFSGLDWLPTLTAAAGNANITEQLLKGVKLGDRTYKNHLDGYNQLDLLTGKGPSVRHELFYFGGPKLGAIRIDDFKFQFYQQPYGWPGEKNTTDMPGIVNIRQDPFERTPSIRGENLNNLGGGYMNDFYAREFWRFVLVHQEVAKLAQTAIEYPPMQAPASFNLDAVKAQVEEVIKNREGQ